MGNPEHIEFLLEGVECWNRLRENHPFTPDLSEVDIHNEFKSRDLLTSRTGRIPLNEINLEGANLSGATLHSADLARANLRCANLRDADLQYADLTYAKVSRADFTNASYPQVNFSGTKAWKAKFQVGVNRSISRRNLENYTITSVSDLLNVINSLNLVGECPEGSQLARDRRRPPIETTLYFRGERVFGHGLTPSVMRKSRGKTNGLRVNEGEMFRDMVSRRPHEFSDTTSALAQWVLAQHHLLKTRFLDITKNPLAALFFACEKKKKRDGCLRIFDVPRLMVKQFDSDTISVIANFAKLTRQDQDRILGKVRKVDITSRPNGYLEAMYYLYQRIQQEKPYFDERINLGDLYRVFVVEPQLSTERVRAQSGAFLVSAFHERFESNKIARRHENTWVYADYALRIPRGCKARIKRELELMNISHETLFPSLDSTAMAIMDSYR